MLTKISVLLFQIHFEAGVLSDGQGDGWKLWRYTDPNVANMDDNISFLFSFVCLLVCLSVGWLVCFFCVCVCVGGGGGGCFVLFLIAYLLVCCSLARAFLLNCWFFGFFFFLLLLLLFFCWFFFFGFGLFVWFIVSLFLLFFFLGGGGVIPLTEEEMSVCSDKHISFTCRSSSTILFGVSN